MLTNTLPKDLIWQLDQLTHPVHTGNFFRSFRNSFCVYSGTVSKLYTEYESHITKRENGEQRLVIMPDMLQFESLFHDIRDEAIMETDMFVFAQRHGNQHRVYLTGPGRSDNRPIKLPFAKGLKALRAGMYQQNRFLPVLKQGDLREIPNQAIPFLRLHRIDLDRLDYKSSFEIKQIMSACWQGLEKTFITG